MSKVDAGCCYSSHLTEYYHSPSIVLHLRNVIHFVAKSVLYSITHQHLSQEDSRCARCSQSPDPDDCDVAEYRICDSSVYRLFRWKHACHDTTSLVISMRSFVERTCTPLIQRKENLSIIESLVMYGLLSGFYLLRSVKSIQQRKP